MSFSSELFKGVKQDLLTPFEYNLTLKNGKVIYIDGFSKIIALTCEEVCFALKKSTLKIVGKNLKIEKLEEFSCVISGNVEGFYAE